MPARHFTCRRSCPLSTSVASWASCAMSGCTFIASTLRAIPLAFSAVARRCWWVTIPPFGANQPAPVRPPPRPSDPESDPGPCCPLQDRDNQCQCGTVTTQKIVIGRRCGGAHASAPFHAAKLNRKMADTARTRQHQNPLGLQATHIELGALQASEARKRQTGVGQGMDCGARARFPHPPPHIPRRHRRSNGKFTMP